MSNAFINGVFGTLGVLAVAVAAFIIVKLAIVIYKWTLARSCSFDLVKSYRKYLIKKGNYDELIDIDRFYKKAKEKKNKLPKEFWDMYEISVDQYIAFKPDMDNESGTFSIDYKKYIRRKENKNKKEKNQNKTENNDSKNKNEEK